jgi:hypothetical protein
MSPASRSGSASSLLLLVYRRDREDEDNPSWDFRRKWVVPPTLVEEEVGGEGVDMGAEEGAVVWDEVDGTRVEGLGGVERSEGREAKEKSPF